MGLETGARGGASQFAAYVAVITPALGQADRVAPMAARVQPGRVRAAHQSLHHVVAKSDWSGKAMLAAVADHVLPAVEQRGPI